MVLESYSQAMQHILAELAASVGVDGATIRECLLVAQYLDYIGAPPSEPPVDVEREAMEARAMADGLA